MIETQPRQPTPDLADPDHLVTPGAVHMPSEGVQNVGQIPDNPNMTALANSLGKFNSALSTFGTAYLNNQESDGSDQKKKDRQGLTTWISIHTPEERRAAYAANNIPSYATPDVQLNFHRQQGVDYGMQLSDQFQDGIAKGTIKQEDAPAWVEQQRQAAIKQYGWDENSPQAAGFGSVINKLTGAAQKQALSGAVTTMQDNQRQTASSIVENAVSEAQKGGLSAADASIAIRKAQAEANARAMMTPKDTDPMVMEALTRRMGVDAATAKWAVDIGNAPRADFNDPTKPFPALFSKAENLDRANSMMQRAITMGVNEGEQTAKDAKKQEVAKLLDTDPAQVHNLPQTLTYTNLANGSSGTVTTKDALNDALNAKIVNDQQRVASGIASPQQVQDEQLHTFATAGQRQHQWADTLKSAAEGAANTDSLTDPKQVPQLTAAMSLYSDLRAKNPAYLHSLMDDKTAAFFRNATIQQEVFGASQTQALQVASKIAGSDHDESSSQILANTRKQVEDVAAKMHWDESFDTDHGKLFDYLFPGGVKNPQIAHETLVDAAAQMVRFNGMKPEDALTAATKYSQDHYVRVNGMLVPDMGFLPKEQMKPTVESWLTSFSNGPGKALNLDPQKLSVMPAGSSSFIVVNSNTGLPVVAPRSSGQGGGFVYTSSRELLDHFRLHQQFIEMQRRGALDAAAKVNADAVNNRVKSPHGSIHWEQQGN